MKNINNSLFLMCLFIFLSTTGFSQTWGVYASGVGERLRVGIDPCWVTYTVGRADNPRIQANIRNGSMGIIQENLSWREATALQRRFSIYYDNEPDGRFKLAPCNRAFGNNSRTGSGTNSGAGGIHTNLSGIWEWPGLGIYQITQNGNSIGGYANGVNRGDHWGEGHRNGGTIAGEVNSDGSITLDEYWSDGTFTHSVMKLSSDGQLMNGTWEWYRDDSKKQLINSGTYSIKRK